MFLPYGDDDVEQQCLQAIAVNDSIRNDGVQAKGYRYNGADFFVRFTYDINAAVLSQIMGNITQSKDVLLDAAL